MHTDEPEWSAPQPPRGRLAEVRQRAAGARRHIADRGRAGITGAEERIRRRLDERATARGPVEPLPAPPPESQQVTLYQPPPLVARPVPPVTWQVPVPVHPASTVERRPSRRLNGAVLAALIVAVLFPPAGLGLAKTARRECRADGRAGAGLALLAHVVAAAGTCAMTLVLVTLFAVFAYGMVQVGSGLHEIGLFLAAVSRLLS